MTVTILVLALRGIPASASGRIPVTRSPAAA